MRKLLTWTAAGFYFAAGVSHFVKTASYLKIMPPHVPWPQAMVYLSGAAEIAGGLGLLLRRSRRWAAFGLIALLVAVFPANVYMATNHVQVTSTPLPVLVVMGPFAGSAFVNLVARLRFRGDYPEDRSLR